MSLATEKMHSERDWAAKTTTQYLEEAGIHWVGLSLRMYDVMVLKGLRIGFLAFCAVYKECMESSSLPFAPVKYSSKMAAKAIQSLKTVSLQRLLI